MISSLFVDLDGTLIDSSAGIARSLNHALDTLGHPPREESSLRPLIGLPLGRVFEALLGKGEPHVLQTAIESYRSHYTKTCVLECRVYPEIAPALDAITRLGVRLSLVTSKPHLFANRILESFGLTKYFRAVHGSPLDGVGEDKAALIRHALVAEGIEPEMTMMVGDRREDFDGARQNGVMAIGVAWGFGSDDELGMADKVVDRPQELVTLIEARLRTARKTRLADRSTCPGAS